MNKEQKAKVDIVAMIDEKYETLSNEEKYQYHLKKIGNLKNCSMYDYSYHIEKMNKYGTGESELDKVANFFQQELAAVNLLLIKVRDLEKESNYTNRKCEGVAFSIKEQFKRLKHSPFCSFEDKKDNDKATYDDLQSMILELEADLETMFSCIEAVHFNKKTFRLKRTLSSLQIFTSMRHASVYNETKARLESNDQTIKENENG